MLWEQLNNEKQFFLCKFTYIIMHFTLCIIIITENWYKLTHAPNIHWWARNIRLCLLRTVTIRIIWIYQFKRQSLSLPLCNTYMIVCLKINVILICMMTSSNGNIFRVTGPLCGENAALCAGNSPVPGEFPAQRPVTRSFDVLFVLRLNKRLSKQSWGWGFGTPS